MMTQNSRLISNLGRHLNGENYLTNALVCLIEELMSSGQSESDRHVGLAILNLIARKNEDPDFTHDTEIVVEPQQSADEGTPDITVSSKLPDGSRRLTLIEVKDRAPVSPGQLVKYRRSLAKNAARYRRVILLSRPGIDIGQADRRAMDHQVDWQEVAERIRESMSDDQSVIGQYLVGSVLQFVEDDKKMVLPRINSDLPKERQFNNLMNMLEMLRASMSDAGFTNPFLSAEQSEDGPCLGFYGTYDERRFWAGVYTEDPRIVELTLQVPPYPTEALDLEDDGVFAVNAAQQRKKLSELLNDNAMKILSKEKRR